MSFDERDPFLIREMIESVDLIFRFVHQMTEIEFAQDLKTQAAVAMMLQRIVRKKMTAILTTRKGRRS